MQSLETAPDPALVQTALTPPVAQDTVADGAIVPKRGVLNGQTRALGRVTTGR